MARTPSIMLELGTPAPGFSLPEPSGTVRSLGDFDDSPALLVAFWCNHCPFVKYLRDAFVDFAREYKPRGLAVVAINANDVATHPADSPERMAEEAQQAGYTFPYVFDETQEVAKAYGAACTPDFFLFDADRRLVYRGQFDDSRPSLDLPVTGADMRKAVDVLLAGGTPSPDQRPSLGCNIKWKPGNAPSYYG